MSVADRHDTSSHQSSHRITELNHVLDEFERVHIEWVESDNREYPDSTYWDAVETLIETFDTGDMPESMRDMSDLVQSLSVELAAHDNRDDQEDQMPGEEFFAAVQAVFKGRQQKLKDERPFYIESIKELHDQKVTHEQIARMYGWVDQWDRPDVRKVKEELDKPGTHINESWVHPEELKRRQRVEGQRRRRESAVTTGIAKKSQKSKPVCPETCHELWQQGVSAEQTSRMLDRPLAEIKREFADFQEEKNEQEKSVEKKRKERDQRLQELTGGKIGRGTRGQVNSQEGGDGEESEEADAQSRNREV